MKRSLWWFLLFLPLFLAETAVWGAQLEVMPSILEVSLSPGQTRQVMIYIVDADGESADFTWQLVPDRNWVQPETVSGQGPAAVKVTITSDNPSQTVASLSVYSDIGNTFVTVKRTFQEEGKGLLEVLPSQVEVTLPPGEEGEFVIYIVGKDSQNPNFSWQLAPEVSWLQPEKVSGQGTAAVKVKVLGQNSSEKVGKIIIYSDLGKAIVSVTRNFGEVEPEPPFNFYTTATEIVLEVTRVPGQEVEGRTFSIGLSCENEPEGGASCSVGTDQPWLELAQEGTEGGTEGKKESSVSCNSSLRLKVNIYKELEEGLHYGHVFINCGGVQRTITVVLILKEEIVDRLVISPSTLNLTLGRYEILPKNVSIKLANANPEGDRFTWKAETKDSWLSVKPTEGSASPQGVTVNLSIDPRGLPAGTYEGTVYFFSDLDETSATEGIPLNITLRILPWHTFEVFPSHLFWSLERGEMGLLGRPGGQVLHIYSSGAGWSVASDAPWLRLNPLWPEGEEAVVEVTLDEAYLGNLTPGRYETAIRVTDREGALLRRVPVTLEIRRQGEAVNLPVPPFRYTQMVPQFARVEGVEAGWLTLRFPAVPILCEEKPTCNLDKIFLLFEAPSFWPGKTWAYRPQEGGFVLIEENHTPVPGADGLYLSLGPLPEVQLGPVPLRGLNGEVFFHLKAGKDYASAKTTQRIELHIYTPIGKWWVTDYYRGEAYPHPDVLEFWRETGKWFGCWKQGGKCYLPVHFYYGDGKTFFYGFEFRAGGYLFQYQITQLTDTRLSGRWRFFDGKSWSSWEKFEAGKSLFEPMLSFPLF